MNIDLAPWQRIMATAIVNSVDGDEVQKALEAANPEVIEGEVVEGEVVEGEVVEELVIDEP